MKIIRPFTVTETALVTSNVTETVSLWSSGTTYAALVQVRVGTRLYESQQASNTNHNPVTDDGTWWVDIGPTNRWAMFDQVNGTVTSKASSITATVQVTGRIDSVALLGLAASTVNVTARSGATEVFNQDFDLVDTTGVTDWYEYFFADLVYKSDLIVSGLPLNADLQVDVAVAGSGTVEIGSCVFGLSRELGASTYGAKLGINDFSRKETDAFGRPTVVERPYSKRGSFTVVITGGSMEEVASKIAAVNKLLAEYRATPLVWVASDTYDATIIFGFYKSFDLEIAYAIQSILTLEIEGLT
jgi:hypothetical protein